MRQIEKAYREDPYGGITPEETLQLFIDALKKGDTDLAAKYFVLDKQEEMRVDLDLVKEKGLLDELLVDLERTVKTKTSNEEVFFVASDEENIVKIGSRASSFGRRHQVIKQKGAIVGRVKNSVDSWLAINRR